MNSIETKLHLEIEDELDKLDAITDKGSDEYKATLDSVTKLMDRAIEMEKLGNEIEKYQLQMREDQKDRLIKNILTGAGIVIPSLITIWGTVKSIKFEETGTITTIIGRGFINKLLPKK